MTILTMPARSFDFDYDEAFSRNIGWVTEWEQQILRTKRVAIAGMGGVGGLHLLTLARLGIGAFHISDTQPVPAAPESLGEMGRILDLARWAPSGDNGQPWRFRIDGED